VVGFLSRDIGIADDPLSLSQYPRQWGTTDSGLNWAELTKPLDNTRLTSHGRGMEALAIKGIEVPVGGPTKTHRPFEHRIEHRREIAGRRIDDLQYLSARGLLSERLVSFGSAFGKLTF
jgi:hypothetical protein